LENLICDKNLNPDIYRKELFLLIKKTLEMLEDENFFDFLKTYFSIVGGNNKQLREDIESLYIIYKSKIVGKNGFFFPKINTSSKEEIYKKMQDIHSVKCFAYKEEELKQLLHYFNNSIEKSALLSSMKSKKIKGISEEEIDNGYIICFLTKLIESPVIKTENPNSYAALKSLFGLNDKNIFKVFSEALLLGLADGFFLKFLSSLSISSFFISSLGISL
jgi:hypothetical protein